MSMHRTLRWATLAVAGMITLAPWLRGSEFQQRMASWQSGGAPPTTNGTNPRSPSDRRGAAMAPAAPAPAMAAPPPGGQVTPEGQIVEGQRVLSQAYQPQPRYAGYGPVPNGCATCGPHAPLHDPDYGPVYDSCQSCGHGGCGLFRHGGPALFCGGCGGGACGGGGCGDCCDAGPVCNQTLVWARFEVLMWWRQGRDFPPMVTTSPVSVDASEAGVLPDAEILFGGDREGSPMAAGGRFDIGTYFDLRQCTGIGWRFWGLGKDATEFTANSLNNPVLAIPFFNADDELNDALLVAYPGLRSGNITVSGSSEVIGNDVYMSFLLCRDAISRLDFITGWHYARMNDGVEIRSRSTITEQGGNIPLGTVTSVVDQFDTRNEFHGGILGLQWQRNCGCWSTRLLARMALGNMREQAKINGSTTFAVPEEDPEVTAGGLFTGEGNIGTFDRDEFTAITEIGLTLGYRWGPCTQISVGYTFIYWNDVITAAQHIDTAVGDDLPQFAFQHGDYWVQGLSLGLIREF